MKIEYNINLHPEIKTLINEKALLSSLSDKKWEILKRLKQIDNEILEIVKSEAKIQTTNPTQ